MLQPYTPDTVPEPLFSERMPGVDPVALADANKPEQIPPSGILVKADVFPNAWVGEFLISHYGVSSDSLGLRLDPSRPHAEGNRVSSSNASQTGMVAAYVGVVRHVDGGQRPYYYTNHLNSHHADFHIVHPYGDKNRLLAVTSRAFTTTSPGGNTSVVESGYMSESNRLSGVRVVEDADEVRALLEAAAKRMGLNELDTQTVANVVASKVGAVSLKLVRLQIAELQKAVLKRGRFPLLGRRDPWHAGDD